MARLFMPNPSPETCCQQVSGNDSSQSWHLTPCDWTSAVRLDPKGLGSWATQDNCCERGYKLQILATTKRLRQQVGGNQVYHSWQLWEQPGVCKYTIMWLDKYFEENGQIMATTLDKYCENNNEQILVTSWDKYGEDIANIVGAVQRQGVVSAVLLLCWRICL